MIAAVIARPVGGILSYRVGPRTIAATSFAGAAVMALVVAAQPKPEIPAGTSFVLMAAFLGLGTGGVFAWVSALAPKERVGSVAGIVGAAGGLGGFFPPLVVGATYDEADHSYTIGVGHSTASQARSAGHRGTPWSSFPVRQSASPPVRQSASSVGLRWQFEFASVSALEAVIAACLAYNLQHSVETEVGGDRFMTRLVKVTTAPALI